MTKTDKYQFNLIDTSDAFSPEALNANARQLETELARVEAAADAGSDAVKSELTAALAQQKSEWQAADAAQKSELQSSIDTKTAELQGSITSTNSSLSSLQSTVSSLKTAVGTGGSTCRIQTGTYTGNGKIGSSNPNSLSFSFKPYLVIIGSIRNASRNTWPSILIQGITNGHSDYDTAAMTVSWSGNKVSWYHSSLASYQNNEDGTTYYYVAIGA